MFSNLFTALLNGALQAFSQLWWMFAIAAAVKYGPRLVRGFLLRRGMMQ